MKFALNLFKAFLSKEKLVAVAGALAIAAAGAALGMQSKEVKDAVCGAPVVEAK